MVLVLVLMRCWYSCCYACLGRRAEATCLMQLPRHLRNRFRCATFGQGIGQHLLGLIDVSLNSSPIFTHSRLLSVLNDTLSVPLPGNEPSQFHPGCAHHGGVVLVSTTKLIKLRLLATAHRPGTNHRLVKKSDLFQESISLVSQELPRNELPLVVFRYSSKCDAACHHTPFQARASCRE